MSRDDIEKGPYQCFFVIAVTKNTRKELDELTLKVARRLCGNEFATQELLAQTVAVLQEALAAAVKPAATSASSAARSACGWATPGIAWT